ncbi:OLC1v1002698C1 [Oldenlandia corymbosa var. corymbosa]|uniref:OLC1v1002698C1 n=1 Tax=Oldenlandia corymbosa var. corymbosa TaxID=529605 RepID=A0AAV1D9H3_OLDCO|nr:OLC1v1002698C1 [Oldenlandia corymbosa var. corymbosa]
MENLQVHILSSKLIKPSNSTPHHLQNFKLSLFDQLAPPMYSHILFYYLPVEDSCNRGKNNVQISLLLEKSLSQVLTKFYPLAGRFVKDDLLIHCADQGVEYFEANVNAQLLGFIQKQPADTDVLSRFLPWDFPPAANSATSPLLAIQINKFECGGFVLGLRVSHVIADAFSMITFIKEWASLCSSDLKDMNQVISTQLSSYNDFVSVFPTRILSGPKFPPPGAANSADQVITKSFLFNEAIVTKMAETADFHPTRVVVVLASIWKALIGVSLAKHGRSRDSDIALSMNLRGKTALAMPEISCGNFWISVLVPLEAKRAEKMELKELMILIQDTIKSTAEQLALATADDISTMLINSRREIFEKRHLSGNEVDVYICTSWCRLPVYDVDFGMGKPCWVSHASKPFEGVALLDGKTGTGIEAWISLKQKEMIEFNRQLESMEPMLADKSDKNVNH